MRYIIRQQASCAVICSLCSEIVTFLQTEFHISEILDSIPQGCTLPPSVCRVSRQCGILNILQPYRPPWPVTGIALLFYFIPQGCVIVLYGDYNRF
jgi:hypothetical protein